jgi:Glyoxalase-like domain
MRLDHVSYVTSHDQLADTVQRLGSRLGSTFVDGGVHPRFGTRNFTLPLQNGQYIEVVCPLDHPATEQTPWGKAVSKKAQEGGGWLTWVFATEDISKVEEKFGRPAIEGHRTRPDGTDLKWKQIGVNEITDSRELPFFIQWLTADHPSQDGKAVAAIEKFKSEILGGLNGADVEFVDPSTNDGEYGIVTVDLVTPNGVVRLD